MVTGAAFGCGLNQEGVPPPANTFFYPSSAVTDQEGRWLFVANSNADLRYNDGTLVTVDLAAAANDWLAADSVRWEPCPAADYVNTPRSTSEPQHFCCWDPQDPNILNCDERAYIQPAATVRMGSFAAGMVMQNATPPRDQAGTPCATAQVDAHRLFVAVRGDTSITWIDVAPGGTPPDIDPYGTPPSLDCGSASGGTSHLPTATTCID